MKLTRTEHAFIGGCYNDAGWLDDSCINYHCKKWKGVKASLEKKGIIYLEEERPESEGGDLYAINPEYDDLFD